MDEMDNISVSTGDCFSENMQEISYSVSCNCFAEETLLWESDISQYGITDGLLLLILVVLSIQAVVMTGRRGKK